MEYEGYECLRVRVIAGVAYVTIDHPPINLFDLALIQEMDRVGRALADDADVRVVVLESANPEFFIAHADVALIQRLPRNVPPKATELGLFHAMVDRFRTMPKATIAKIEGRTRGGGSELVLSLDMRFAARGRAVLAQPEVALGIIPGGSGTQRLPRLMGRSRALEVILGCEDFDADAAERYGWVNRALPAAELGPFVDRLARRIASFPAEAITLAKASVDAAELATRDGLLEEAHYFNRALATAAAERRMQWFLANGGQTPEVERPRGHDRTDRGVRMAMKTSTKTKSAKATTKKTRAAAKATTARATKKGGKVTLAPGDKAPAFALPDQSGTIHRLADHKGRKLLVYFYPKADTPGCTAQSCSVRDARAGLGKRGVDVVGISPDKPAAQQKFDTKYGLGFPLLGDEDHAVAEAFGVWGEKSMYGRKYMGIVRSAFLIDEQGKIAAAWYGVSPKDTVPGALAALAS